MRETALITPVELTDAELDAVGAGQNTQGGVGLVNVGAQIGDITVDALNNNRVTLTDVVSHNTLTTGVGVAVAILSGATGVLNRFA